MNKQVLNAISSAIGTLALLSTTAFAGEKVNESKAISADGFVSVDVQSGKVKMLAWDKNEIKIVGELDDDAEGYEFEVNGNKVLFKVKMPEKRWGNYNSGDGSNLEVWLPTKSKLRFEGVNVDVEAKGVTGGSMIDTVNGDIKATGLTHKVKLETVNGSIYSRDLSGKIGLNTVNGEVEDTGSKGQMAVETVNGDIKVETMATELTLSNVNADMRVVANKVNEIEVSTVNGDLDIELGLTEKGRFTFSSVSGDADILFTSDVSADFDIEAHAGGDIYNYITDEKAKEAKYGPSERLRFKVGSGSADVEIDTVSGDVKLKKK